MIFNVNKEAVPEIPRVLKTIIKQYIMKSKKKVLLKIFFYLSLLTFRHLYIKNPNIVFSTKIIV